MEELRKKQERVNGAGTEYKSEAGQTANGVGPFSGGGNPKALEQLPQTDCGLQKGKRSGHVPHSPCPISFSDHSLPQLDLPKALAH